jgi:hypothetical protein
MEANSESRGHNTQKKKKKYLVTIGGEKKVLCSNCNLGMIDRKP